MAMFTFGSRGDMQPMFALADYLQRERGMRLLVFVPENNEAFGKSLGLEFISIWGESDVVVEIEVGERAFGRYVPTMRIWFMLMA